MKKTITQYVYMREDYTADFSGKEWAPSIYPYALMDGADRILIGPINVDVVIPDDFDPVPKQVAALEAEKLEALKAYQKSVADINERLAKLQAIGNEVPA